MLSYMNTVPPGSAAGASSAAWASYRLPFGPGAVTSATQASSCSLFTCGDSVICPPDEAPERQGTSGRRRSDSRLLADRLGCGGEHREVTVGLAGRGRVIGGVNVEDLDGVQPAGAVAQFMTRELS